jgi:hypothetical protein
MRKPIDLIHQATVDGAHPKLNERVIIASPELQHLLTSVTMPGDWRYMDVPVPQSSESRILNGGPAGAVQLAPSGPVSARERLGARAIRYLEGPLRCLAMPEAPGAKRALKLTSYAGAVICSNGAHRLAAAIPWQLRPGASGLLQMAATHERPELAGRVAAILAYAGDGALEFVQLHAPAQLDQLATLADAQCDLAVRLCGGSQESLLAFPTDGGPPRGPTSVWMATAAGQQKGR